MIKIENNKDTKTQYKSVKITPNKNTGNVDKKCFLLNFLQPQRVWYFNKIDIRTTKNENTII